MGITDLARSWFSWRYRLPLVICLNRMVLEAVYLISILCNAGGLGMECGELPVKTQ